MRNWGVIGALALAAVIGAALTLERSGGLVVFQPRDPPTLAAIGGAEAYSGGQIRFGDMTFRVVGVTCPDPSTEAGRDAKALANTFLKITGRMTCTSTNGFGDCTAETVDGKRKLSEVLRASGHCS